MTRNSSKRLGMLASEERSTPRRGRILVQPVLLLELARQVLLGQVLEVLVGEGVQLILEAGPEHALDLVLPGLLIEPAVLEELLGPAHVLVVELDPHVARQAVAIGIGAGEADELGLGDGHALALEGEVDRALLHHGVDVVTPRVVVDEDIDGKLVLLVETSGEAADPARGLAVAREEDAVVAAPELVFGEAVPLRPLLHEEDEVRRAALNLDVFRLHDGRHGVAALAQARAVHAVAVVVQHHGAHDAPRVLGAHVELLAQRGQGHLEVLDERIALVLAVEGILVRALHGVLGAVVDLAERRREVGALELAEGVSHQHRLHELLGHAHVEEGAGLLALAHLDDAALLIEVDVGEAAHGDGQRRILAALGGGDHGVRHSDQLFLDRSHLARRCFRHGYLFLRRVAFAGRADPFVFRGTVFVLAAFPLAGFAFAAAPAVSPTGSTGASPSGPSGVTMMECGSPSGPPSWPRIWSVLAPPVRLRAIFWSWFLSFSLGSLPPLSRAQASTTSSM